MNRSVEIRAQARGDLITPFRWTCRGVPAAGHRNETLAMLVRVDRAARLLGLHDEENQASPWCLAAAKPRKRRRVA